MAPSAVAETVGSLLGRPQGPLALCLRNGPRQGQIVRLHASKLAIGSSPKATLRVKGAGIDPIHCVVFRGAKHTLVRRWAPDTRLNGGHFEDAFLRQGDRLSVGSLDFEVLETSDLPPSVQPDASQQQRPEQPAHDATANADESQKELEKRQHEIETLRAELAQKRQEWDELREAQQVQLVALREQLAQQQSQRAVDLESLASEREKLAAIRRELDAKEQDRAAQEQLVLELRQQVDAALHATESAHQEKDAARQQLVALNQQLGAARSESVSLRAELDQRQNESKQGGAAESHKLRCEIESQKQELISLESALHKLQADLQKQSQENSAFSTKLHERETELSQQESELRRREVEVLRRETHADEQARALAERESELDRRQTDLSSQESDLQERLRELDARQDAVGAVRGIRPTDELDSGFEAGETAKADEEPSSRPLNTLVEDNSESKQASDTDDDDVFARLRAMSLLKEDKGDRNHESEVAELSRRHEVEPSGTEMAHEALPPAQLQEAEARPAGNGDEESIDDYMARLMQRVKGIGDSEPSVKINEPKPTTARVQPAQVVSKTIEPKPTAPSGKIESPKLPPIKLEPLKPAPEKFRDLAAMREIANLAARNAIAQHHQSVRAGRSWGWLTAGAVGLIIGIALLVVDFGFGSISLFAGIGIVAVSAFLLGTGIWLLLPSKQAEVAACDSPAASKDDQGPQASSPPTPL